MAHPDTGAADAPAPQSASDKAADFENYLFGDEEDETSQESEEGEPEEGDLDLDEGEEQDDEADEPETAIDPPASLNAEEKKVFAQLPPEAQRTWAESENRRNQQVQEATSKAAERERAALQAAEQAEAVAEQRRAAQLRAFVDHFRPQMPNPQLAQTDPASYIALKAQYDFEAAQFAEIEQQIEAVTTESQQKLESIDQAQRMADLMSVPKLADPATRDEYVKTSLALVSELGLDPAAFEQVASSHDFRALEKVAEWKAKAEKYEKAVSRQMQKVRAAKGKNLRPAGGSHGNARRNGDWERVKTASNKTAQANAMADFLEKQGYL